MAKTRRNSSRKSNVVKSITNKALPVVDKSLRNVGKVTKDVVETSIPVIEKGVSVVYDTMSSGLDLGVKGVKTVSKKVTSSQRNRKRSYIGGKKTRHRKRHSKRKH